jgi:hypothetical protein
MKLMQRVRPEAVVDEDESETELTVLPPGVVSLSVSPLSDA